MNDDSRDRTFRSNALSLDTQLLKNDLRAKCQEIKCYVDTDRYMYLQPIISIHSSLFLLQLDNIDLTFLGLISKIYIDSKMC